MIKSELSTVDRLKILYRAYLSQNPSVQSISLVLGFENNETLNGLKVEEKWM